MQIIYDPVMCKYVLHEDFTLQPCDIFFTRGNGLFSKLIRLGEKTPGDLISIVNHTGIITEPGTIKTANVIEALWKVEHHTLWSQYHNKKDEVAIFRPIGIDDEQKTIIVNKALDYEGRNYGWLKIATHAGDFFIGGHYFFRRLTDDDKYPICSWVVAHSYGKAGLHFGCDPGQANPDDIWDYCINHPNKYQYIFPLNRI